MGDLEQALDFTAATLARVPDAEWHANAGSLEWTRWETVEHVADCLFAYAGQIAVPTPDRYVAFLFDKRRPGGPPNTVFADPEVGAAGLVEMYQACGAFLAAMARTASPDVRSYHPYGVSDPDGFAAMGIVESFVHLDDITEGLPIDWEPPADVCAHVLERLFPDAPADTDPWLALQWCTGRIELPGRARLTKWRWNGTPRP